ncbi:(p)pGpp hydrolase [Orientia tsutsugamushi]|nr:(p)pGpp hydrolase [Orientia tsutsugamushi]
MIDFYSESLLNKLFETNVRFNTEIDLDKVKEAIFYANILIVSHNQDKFLRLTTLSEIKNYVFWCTSNLFFNIIIKNTTSSIINVSTHLLKNML